MPELIIHPKTREQLAVFLSNPTHGLLLAAPKGSGKAALATYLSEQLLRMADVSNYPYLRTIRPHAGKPIGIDEIRELDHFLSLKVPSRQTPNRIIIVEDSGELTTEAQNSLLKTLEEPPLSTILLLTTEHEQALLPTLRSRLQTVRVLRPPSPQLESYFVSQGFPAEAVNQALALSNGQPGLMQAFLSQTDHPLRVATEYARTVLQATLYERLLLVDELSKSRVLAADICFTLQQMAQVSLRRTNLSNATRWRIVLEAAYKAADELAGNAQPKLVLTALMLNL